MTKPVSKYVLIAAAFTVFFGSLLSITGSGFPEQQQKQVIQKNNPEQVLDEVRSKLKETKRALAREGKYSCCISPSCDFCALSVGKCPCNENLSNGDPVCHECKGGWQAGYGLIDDVQPEEVKTPPKEMTKMMYDARAKKYLKKK
ncbi:MAG: hypothetical protein WEB62_10195 [Bacteroidota bacterium]